MVEQGLVWVWGQKGAPGSDVAVEAALKSPQLIEELADPHYEGRVLPFSYNTRDLPYGWDMFMEVRCDLVFVVTGLDCINDSSRGTSKNVTRGCT